MTTMDASLERRSLLERPLLESLALDWEKTLYALIVVAAIVTRFYALGARVMSHDESLHTYFAFNLFEGKGFQHTPLMHGPLKFHLSALSYWLLGDSDFSARVPTAIFGVVAVSLPMFLRKWLGRTGALAASLLMLISPFMLYYSRYIRDEPIVVVWGLLMALITFSYMEKPDARWLYGLAAVTALFYTTMESSYIYVAIWLLFLGLTMLRDVLARQWPEPGYKRVFVVCVAGALTAVLATGVFFYLSRNPQLLNPSATAEPLSPLSEESHEIGLPPSPFNRGIAASGALAAFFVLAGTTVFLLGFKQAARHFAALDLIVILWTFVMPQLAAFPVSWLGRDPLDYSFQVPPIETLLQGFQRPGPALTRLFLVFLGLIEFLQGFQGAAFTLLVFGPILFASIAIGLVWDWRKWLVCAGIFYGIFLTFFTTVFTNGGGFATGIVGSLGYWLAQQGIRRGNQPPYYYVLVQIPMYEFLPALGALGAMIYGLIGWIAADPLASPDGPEGSEAAGRPRAAILSIGGAVLGALIGGRIGARLGRYAGTILGATVKPRRAEGPAEASTGELAGLDDLARPAESPAAFPTIPFLAFWSVAGVIAFSIAGEKMPWLTTHITLPFILLAGWFFGEMIDGTDWPVIRERGGWVVAAIFPVFAVALVSALLSLSGVNRPFQGKELAQLQATFGFISALLVAGVAAIGLIVVGRRTGWVPLAQLVRLSIVGLLVILTARVAILASFVNYDNATEFMVYAHGAPAVKTVMAQIEDISRRTDDGLGLRVAYDDDVSWPMTWYFRNYTNQVFYGAQPTRETLDVPVVVAGDSNWAKVEPLLGNRYYSFEYIRMWWPMQEYFNLDWTRIKDALTKPEWREALWDIWWARDYTKYGELTATDYSLSRWPVADRMKLYVRKDIAAQIWDYGVGPAQLSQALPEDPFKNLKQARAANIVVGTAGQGGGQFSFPRSLVVAPDGTLYVADTRNHRIQKMDAAGKFVVAWGTFGDISQNTADPGKFNEPWGIAADSKGNVFVSDTWNHRVQKFDANGNFLTTWGNFGTGEGNSYSMWGPRGIAVDAQDRVYVADTGNKRVLVFDADGNALGQIGSAGSLDGQFDEPVGVAVAADGRVFVADTWNQRVQVFKPDYSYLAQWPINGWFGQSLDNKPYLAVDGQGRVYVTDPEGYRVLVFTEDGKPVTTWGDFGQNPQTFGLVAGITLDAGGNVWVADANNNRVMRFPPLP